MSLGIVLAMLGAATLQAAWHTMVKAHRDRLVALTGIHVVTLGVGIVLATAVAPPPAAVLGLLVFSVAVHFAYKLALMLLYARGDLGLVYPLARGLAPLAAAGLAAWGLGQRLAHLQLLAVLSISGGVAWLAISEATWDRRAPATFALAALTGAAAGTYSVVDAAAMARCEDWLSFVAWLFVADSVFFLAYASWRRGATLLPAILAGGSQALGGGVVAVASFWVFLWAINHGAVGIVAALREASVVLAVVFGTLFLKESRFRRRIGPATLTAGGIIAASIRSA